jgi:NAD+ synthase (glutamine-hydrolysing)
MKIALAQINPIIGNFSYNLNKIASYTDKAKQRGADLVIFPELATCGYPPQDLLLKASFIETNLEALADIAKLAKDIAILVGFVDKNKGSGRPLHNSAAFIVNQKIQSIHHKTLLPTYDVFDEDRYFEPANKYDLAQLANSKFAVSICEDIWTNSAAFGHQRYNKDPINNLLKLGPQFLINISSSPYSVGKEKIRQDLLVDQAKKYNLPVVYVNQVGGNDELIFDGRSLALDKSGNIIGLAQAFTEDLIIVDTDTNKSELKESLEEDIANIHQALMLGTRDYMTKCGFSKAVIGLSGGIDSAVVAAVAVEAMGAENVIGIAMPSPYSSKHSLIDAKDLADILGIKYQIISIGDAMQCMDNTLQEVFAHKPKDVTEENIQARLRGLILMALSNKFGYLLLTTGNKSELAVGYCTLYGDMCGGLAVISDVPKLSVYELAHYINRKADKFIISKSIIEKPPSAELRPNQKDSDALPDYSILDPIIYFYVEEHKSASEIVSLGYDAKVVIDIINRIDNNEYKRYQSAPGLKVMSRSFGSGWRMPIVKGFKERLNSRNLLC